MEPAKKRLRVESSKQEDLDLGDDAESEELQLAVDEDGRVGVSGSAPNYAFRSFPNYLAVAHSRAALATMQSECQRAFTAREAQKGEAYSQGETFWVPATASPTTLLEQLALRIFRLHAGAAEFDPMKSGAEWWTQVIELDADIGWHWDRDYGLEADTGFSLHPHVATVTYLTDIGAPTVILESVHQQPQGGASMTSALCPQVAHLSQPRLGKHISFDGRWLHAAPSDLVCLAPPSTSRPVPSRCAFRRRSLARSRRRLLALRRLCKRLAPGSRKVAHGHHSDVRRRITFLVNVWLNHRPLNVTPFPTPAAEGQSSNEGSRLLPCAAPREVRPVRVQCTSPEDAEVFVWHFQPGGEDDAEEGEEEESNTDEDAEEEEDEETTERQWRLRLSLPMQRLRQAMLEGSSGAKHLPDSFTVDLAPGLAHIAPPGTVDAEAERAAEGVK